MALVLGDRACIHGVKETFKQGHRTGDHSIPRVVRAVIRTGGERPMDNEDVILSAQKGAVAGRGVRTAAGRVSLCTSPPPWVSSSLDVYPIVPSLESRATLSLAFGQPSAPNICFTHSSWGSIRGQSLPIRARTTTDPFQMVMFSLGRWCGQPGSD